jgi:hypothetical protein
MQRIFTLVLALAVVTVLAPAAKAQSPADVLKSRGLLGVWAPNCSKNADAENVHATYELRGNRAYQINEFGRRDEFEVTRATIVSAQEVEFVYRNKAGQSLTIQLYVDFGGRIRTWTSSSSGTVFVNQGVVVGNGRPTQWLTKCK